MVRKIKWDTERALRNALSTAVNYAKCMVNCVNCMVNQRLCQNSSLLVRSWKEKTDGPELAMHPCLAHIPGAMGLFLMF